MLLAGAAASAVVPAGAQIYAGTAGSGAVVLSNFQTDDTPDLVIAPPPAPPAPVVAAGAAVAPIAAISPGAKADAARAAQLKPLIQKVAQETSMSPLLLHAVIAVESGYDAKAVSRKGAQGLMQLMPKTAQRFGVRNALDPMENVRGGALYLKWLLDYFDGDLRLALAGYNAGEQEVVRAGYKIPANKETRDYVPKVLARLKRPLAI
ncbi:MAG TPA: lytic transglycosylase domain-containing protein [Burkholderiaceae bacterium]|jgi:soluble lytic murein transglycosylase-like protein